MFHRQTCCLCRAASRVRTRQAWHAAVRHTGLLFQLPTPPSTSAHNPPAAATATPSTADPPPSAGSTGVGGPDASCAERSAGEHGAACLEAAAAELPYPQLAQSVSSASFAPAAHLAEHYSPPGGGCNLCFVICSLCCLKGISDGGHLGVCGWRAVIDAPVLWGRVSKAAASSGLGLGGQACGPSDMQEPVSLLA